MGVVRPTIDPVVPETSKVAMPVGAFEQLASAGTARSGRLWTAHGPVETPCFMPVGTYGAVKGLLPEELRATGTQMLLANAYHLRHRPGPELVRALGGLHRMMGFEGPILTDSGGYQVFSLRGLQKIDEEGVDYRTHFDGSKHRMTPRSVLEIQAALGSDVCMVLDHCPPGEADRATVEDAMDRTTRWAKEAVRVRDEVLASDQLCFGIVQGGTDLELRRRHLSELAELRFDGLALGGLSVGEPIERMHATLAAIGPEMMGIGTPLDLLVAVTSGIDMFDCVMPTRHARNGQLFTFAGRVNLRRAEFRDARGPVDPDCGCLACRRFDAAYLRHLHVHDDPLYVRLATIHNLWFFHEWMALLRGALRDGRFDETRRALAATGAGAAAPNP